MPWPLLYTTKHNINNLDASSNSIQTSIEIHTQDEQDNEEGNWRELPLIEHSVCYHYLFLK